MINIKSGIWGAETLLRKQLICSNKYVEADAAAAAAADNDELKCTTVRTVQCDVRTLRYL